MSDASDDSFNDDPIDQDEYDDHYDEEAEQNNNNNNNNTTDNDTTNQTTTLTSATSQSKHKTTTRTEHKSDYMIHDSASLSNRIAEEVADVASLLDITPQMGSMLLRGNGWSKDKMTSQYMENGPKMLSDLGLQHIDKDAEIPTNTTEEFNCRICDDDVPIEKTLGHPCSHRFCLDCWRSYMDDAIATGRNCIMTHCASYKCPHVIPDRSFKKVVTPEAYQKYELCLIRSFVEDNKRMKWCPAPNCIYAAEAFTSTVTTVQCKCGHKFCFACNEENHEPASCADVAKWLDKCRNESETAHWIIANTKKCPKCMVRIEKNQGCNHITCRSCKYEWCWVCHGSWAEHGNHTGGFYKCNKYDPKNKAKAEKGSAEEAKAELDRYLHYYQRYHNHEQAKKFAERQKSQTEARMTQLQTSSSSAWIDVQFLSAATQQVLECRHVLKYTYVFAYFLPDGPEKTLFEYLQQDLEKNTEHLSELSEMPLDKIDRQATINYTRVTQKFLENLLRGVADGLTS